MKLSVNKSVLRRILDLSQYFNSATLDIPLMRVLYYCAAPLSFVCIQYGLVPNVITTLSNLVAGIALICLIFVPSPWAFFVFWNLALFLDISDGTVARATKRFSANGGFYDHYSDFIKIGLLCLALTFRYPSACMRIVAILALLFFGLLNGINEQRGRFDETGAPTGETSVDPGIEMISEASMSSVNFKSELKRHCPKLFNFLKGTYKSFVIVQGQLIFLISFASMSELCAQILVGWFGLMSLKASKSIGKDVCRFNRLQFDRAKVSKPKQ